MAELQLTQEQSAVIGLKIRESRIQQGLQQKDLVAGEFSKSYISLIESGRVLPSAKALKVIAVRLGVTVDHILSLATPGSNTHTASENDAEVFARWDLILDEARIALYQKLPEHAKQVLTQKIKTRQLSSDQIKLYHYYLGLAALDTNDQDTALSEFKNTSQMSHSLGDVEMEIKASYKLGTVYSLQSKYMLAMENFRKALDLLNTLPVQDVKLRLQLISSLGDCYRNLGDNDQAIELYSEAMSTIHDLQDYKSLADTAWRTSLSYREVNSIPLARSFASKSLALYESIENMNDLVSAKTRLGLMLIERKDYEQARVYLAEARTLALQMGEKQLAAVAGLNLANLHGLMGNNEEALKQAQESVQYAKESGDASTIGQALARLGQAYTQNNRAEESREFFEQAIQQLKETGSQDVLAQTYFEYGQVLSQLGRTEEALRAMEKAYHMQMGGRNYNQM